MLEQQAIDTGICAEEECAAIAARICTAKDGAGVQALVRQLYTSAPAAAESMRVLQHVAERRPDLLVPHATEITDCLAGHAPRMVGGTMVLLASIADLCAPELMGRLPLLIRTYKNGSVVVVDSSITVFAKLCAADERYERSLFPMLLLHLNACRPKELPQHAQRVAICVHKGNARGFVAVLEKRKPELSPNQLKRLGRVLRQAKLLLN